MPFSRRFPIRPRNLGLPLLCFFSAFAAGVGELAGADAPLGALSLQPAAVILDSSSFGGVGNEAFPIDSSATLTALSSLPSSESSISAVIIPIGQESFFTADSWQPLSPESDFANQWIGTTPVPEASTWCGAACAAFVVICAGWRRKISPAFSHAENEPTTPRSRHVAQEQ